MIKSSKTLTTLLIIGILSVAAVLADTFFLFSIKTSLDSSSALEGELEVERRVSSQLQASKEVVAGTAEERDKVETFFVGKDGVVAFLENLEVLGRDAGLEMEVSSVGLVEEKQDRAGERSYEDLSVNITSKGSWTQNFRFLSILENMPLKLQITRAIIEKQAGGNQNSPWLGSFAINVMKLK